MHVIYGGNLADKTKLPDNTKHFICPPEFSLTELPILNNILKSLYCGHNNLMELPELPQLIKQLYCTNNNIKYLSAHNCDVIKEIKKLYILNNPVSFGFDCNDEFKAYLE